MHDLFFQEGMLIAQTLIEHNQSRFFVLLNVDVVNTYIYIYMNCLCMFEYGVGYGSSLILVNTACVSSP